MGVGSGSINTLEALECIARQSWIMSSRSELCFHMIV
jgi:hypothetical protein